MNDVKKALTRKLGPLPAWGWAVVAFVAVYWYRNRKGAQSLVDNTGGSNQPGAITTDLNPQPQTVLQPGESVYDPNTGGFITAPGGGSAGGDTGAGTGADTGVADAINNLVNALETGNGQAVNLPPDSNSGSTTGGHGPGKRHTDSGKNKKPGRWSRGSKGMDTRVDHKPGKSSKRTPKSKNWSGQPKTGKTNKTDRSTAKGHDNHRANTGGSSKKTTIRTRVAAVGKTVAKTPVRAANTAKSHPAQPATNARSRPTTAAVRAQPTVQQRPAATHPVARPAPPPPKPRTPPPPPRRRGR